MHHPAIAQAPAMYSRATRATLLVMLDKHVGQWCSVAWLAQRTCLPTDDVACYCQTLVQDCQVQRRTIDGALHFGVGCSCDSQVVTQ